MLAALAELARDLAVLAASAGVAWWCWEQFRTSTERGDQAARLSLTAERQSVELRQWAEKLDERTTAMSAHLAQAAREDDARQAAKVQVHRLLHATTDPFLTFVEIERALGAEGGQLPAGSWINGDRLRRVLIGLVADGVVAQLDRDRYFIASDYEADHENGTAEGGTDGDAA